MTSNKKYEILLVDDDDFLVDMYCMKFSQAGHKISFALSVEDAIEKLKEKDYSPDAIVLDLVMRERSGFELLEEIRANKYAEGAVLIVLSNQGEPKDLERAKSLGAIGHIIKSNSIPSEVIGIVEGIISRKLGSRR